MNFTRRLTLALLALVPIAGLARADADPKVKDDAHFFKQATVDKVDGELRQLKADTNVEIVVESLPGVPDNLQEKWTAAKDDPQLKETFFEDWTEARGHELKLSGVYILILKNPAHLQIKVGKNTLQKAFVKADREKMNSILLDSFKAKEFDDGLQKAIDSARDAIKRNLDGQKHPAVAGYDPFPRHGGSGASAPPSPSANTNVVPTPRRSGSFFSGGCMTILLIIVGVIVLLSVIGRLSGNRNANNGGGYGGGQGYGGGGPGYGGGQGYGAPPSRGGGFMSGIFGGLLGGAAGSYIENRMENHGSSNTGGTPPTDTGYTPPAQNDSGSSGGDFGSSSGGDSGSSGGDFGGGGGGDSGSSGGDF